MATISVKDATGATVVIQQPLPPGAAAAAASRPVALSSGDAARFTALTSPGLYATVSVTRPGTTPTYAAGDVVGGVLDFNLAALSGKSIEIRTVSHRKDVAAFIAGETSYVLHCYSVTPPSALADDASWTLPSGDRASYLGPINIGTPIAATSTLYVELNAVGKMLRLSGTHLFAYLVTSGSYVAGASAVHTINIHAVQL